MDFSEFGKELDRETKKLEAESRIWEKEFRHAMSEREKAHEYEKLNKPELAISTYLENINYCQSSKKINGISTYAHDINRVIILYGKTGQKELLKEFLTENIALHPEMRGIEKWKDRLAKLNQ